MRRRHPQRLPFRVMAVGGAGGGASASNEVPGLARSEERCRQRMERAAALSSSLPPPSPHSPSHPRTTVPSHPRTTVAHHLKAEAGVAGQWYRRQCVARLAARPPASIEAVLPVGQLVAFRSLLFTCSGIRTELTSVQVRRYNAMRRVVGQQLTQRKQRQVLPAAGDGVVFHVQARQARELRKHVGHCRQVAIAH